MPVLPDNTGSVIDSRGSCVPHSLDSIVLDHRSFMEAGGNLKRAKLKWAYVFTYMYRESIYILLRNSRSPVRYNFRV